MIIATSYPEPSAFFCIMAGVGLQSLVVVGCLIGLGLAFSQKTIRAASSVARFSAYAATASAVLIGLSLLLDAKNIASPNNNGFLLAIFMPTILPFILRSWCSHQEKRLADNGT